MTIDTIVQEIALLSESLCDSQIYFSEPGVAQGVEAIQQAADAFAAARNDHERREAALWLADACQLLSSNLPDIGDSEHSTGWATALQISRLLGSQEKWVQLVSTSFNAE